LENTTVKLASVVSDVFGKSARRMLEALVAGAREAAKLSAMALGSLRRKIPQLEVGIQTVFLPRCLQERTSGAPHYASLSELALAGAKSNSG
jgi:hypothetical protein